MIDSSSALYHPNNISSTINIGHDIILICSSSNSTSQRPRLSAMSRIRECTYRAWWTSFSCYWFSSWWCHNRPDRWCRGHWSHLWCSKCYWCSNCFGVPVASDVLIVFEVPVAFKVLFASEVQATSNVSFDVYITSNVHAFNVTY